MPSIPSSGLASILPKTVRACLLSSPPLLFNWDEKLRGLVVGICLSRSLILQSIAQTKSARVKTTENALSAFLGQKRLALDGPQRGCVIHALKSFGKRRFRRHRGKAVLIVDWTAHPKARSRGKIRPLPAKGKVRLHNLPTNEVLLVPGYQEVWVAILMADGTVLPVTRELWSENGPDCASFNLVELAEIRKARGIVREALKLDVILVADSGFRRKDLLHWLKKVEGMDFIIRLEGRLTVTVYGSKGLLEDAATWWPKRLRMPWRKDSKKVLVSDISAHRVSVVTEFKESVSFNVIYSVPVNKDIEPMFLATTLTTENASDLMRIVWLYSRRWGIETFFWKFKEGLKAGCWRVFSSWAAIDNLLTAAHMAYLILTLLAEFCRQGRTRSMRLLMRRLRKILRRRFARPPELTLGRFFQILAMDFPSPRWAGGVL